LLSTALDAIRNILDRIRRAVILEQAGHVHESVEALEQMLTSDRRPTLLNALVTRWRNHTSVGHAEGSSAARLP